MVLCKQYQGGSCDTVFTCPNEHVNIKDIIQRDMNEVVNGKIWPLSSYGPFMNKSSLPNYIEDQSFEEVRMAFYETKLKNFFGQNHEKYNKDVQEARNKMKVTPDIVNVAIILYDSSMGGVKNSCERNRSSATIQITSVSTNNGPFGREQFASANFKPGLSTTSNNNFVFGFPIPVNTFKSNNTNNPFGRANTASAIVPPLTMEYPFNYNINNSSGITNSFAGTNSKQDKNNSFGISNATGFTFKPFPSDKSINILKKETVPESASSNNHFGMENAVGAKSHANPSTNNNKNSFQFGNTTSNLAPAFGTNSSSSTMENSASADCRFGSTTISGDNSNSKNLFGSGFGNTGWYSCTPNMFKSCLFQSTGIDLWPDDHFMVKKIDKSMMDLMLVDMLPYRVVNGTAFKRLQFADPIIKSRYKLKTEQFFSATLMPETHKKVKEKIMTMMATTKWISLTIDKWSYPDDANLLVIFTAHFLQGTLRKKLVLAAKVLENDQLGSYVTEKLPEIINNFKLEEKLHIAVSDNVHNLETTKIIAFECVAHTIQLVVHDVIFQKEQVQEILAKCRKIAKHFEMSKQASEYFQMMQGKYLLEKQCLLQDIETNWNSTYLMMQRFVKQKIAVSLYADEKGNIENLTTEEWDLLKDIVQTLEIIYEATTELSADSATVSLIIPIIDMLYSRFNEANAVSPLQNDLKRALNERFKYIETSPLLITSTLLDPRFKNIYLSSTQMAIAEKEISKFLQIDTKNFRQNCNEEDQQHNKSNNTLWEKHDVIIETDVSFRKELSLYIQEPLALRKSNIYIYWNTSRYEKFKKVAEKYLFIPPTIVENEQMLKSAGRLYVNRKADLNGVNAEDLLFCHFNIQLLEFDY